MEALSIIDRYGVSVFSVGRNKRPIYPGDHPEFGRGFHAATKDPERVRRMFSHPDAVLVGVPTGSDNDLLVIDFDTPRVPEDVQARHKDWLTKWSPVLNERARIVQTPSGGLHIHLRWPQGSGRMPRNLMRGVDVQGEGQYVIFPTPEPTCEGAPWYRLLNDPPAGMLSPVPGLLDVVEDVVQGYDGASSMSREAALAALQANTDRHNAMLRLTSDAARAVVQAGGGRAELLRAAHAVAEDIEDVMREAGLATRERIEELTEIIEEPHYEALGGELGRAIWGAFRHFEKAERFLSDDKELVEQLAAAGEHEFLRRFGVSRPANDTTSVLTSRRLFVTADEPFEPPPNWVLPGLFRERGSAMLIGMSGVGKTTITAAIIAALSAGETEKLGFAGVDAPVACAWINAEEETGTLRRALEAAYDALGLTPKAAVIVAGCDRPEDGWSLLRISRAGGPPQLQPNEALVRPMINELREAGVTMLFADPTTEFHDGEENDRQHARQLYNLFSRIAREVGASYVLASHTGKPPDGKRPDWYRHDPYSARGSSQGTGAMTMIATLSPDIPPIGKQKGQGASEVAWAYWRRARNAADATTPNIVRLQVVKVKDYPMQAEVLFEIRPWKKNENVAVALPQTPSEARVKHDARAMTDGDSVALEVASELARVLGPGVHPGTVVNSRMVASSTLPWTGAARPEKSLLKAYVDAMQAHLAAHPEDGGWVNTVRFRVRFGKCTTRRFTARLRKFPVPRMRGRPCRTCQPATFKNCRPCSRRRGRRGSEGRETHAKSITWPPLLCPRRMGAERRGGAEKLNVVNNLAAPSAVWDGGS